MKLSFSHLSVALASVAVASSTPTAQPSASFPIAPPQMPPTETPSFPTPMPTLTPAPAPGEPLINVALGKPTAQSSTGWYGVSSRAVDGNTSGNYANESVTHTYLETNPSWEVYLKEKFEIKQIKVYNRDSAPERLAGFKVIVRKGNQEVWSFQHSEDTPDAVTQIDVPDVVGDRVEVVNPGHKYLSLAEVEVFGDALRPTNVALGKFTTQSSTHGIARSSRAVDGNTSGYWRDLSVTATAFQSNPSWEVYLQDSFEISSINIYNRMDCCSDRLSDFMVIVWNGDEEVWSFEHSGGTPDEMTQVDVPDMVGDRVEVMLPGTRRLLSLAEVEVYGVHTSCA
mmetsp:Transcript_30720/g.46554  ORF Transcript_30720/g.46554 Transcript_30720/m.46554 type:complete len:340 (+) Transcript_30720:222-1241(+)